MLNTPNYISRPFSASVSLSNPPHPPDRRLDRTSFTHSARLLLSLAFFSPLPRSLSLSIYLSLLLLFVLCCVSLLSFLLFFPLIRTIGYGTHFPAALLTGTSRHMPLGSAGRRRAFSSSSRASSGGGSGAEAWRACHLVVRRRR